jgi:hypothetical protein
VAIGIHEKIIRARSRPTSGAVDRESKTLHPRGRLTRATKFTIRASIIKNVILILYHCRVYWTLSRLGLLIIIIVFSESMKSKAHYNNTMPLLLHECDDNNDAIIIKECQVPAQCDEAIGLKNKNNFESCSWVLFSSNSDLEMKNEVPTHSPPMQSLPITVL